MLIFDDNTVNRAAADVLEGARSTARLTIPQLAEAAKMSSVTVQKALSGKQSMKVPQFLRIAGAAKADLSKVLQAVIDQATLLSDATAKNVIEFPGTSADEYTGYKAADEFDEGATRPDED